MNSAFFRRLGGLKNTSSTVDLSNMDLNAVRRAAGRPAVDIPETVVASRTPPSVVRIIPKSTVERLGEINEFTRQAREERPQGITFVNQLSEESTIVPTKANTAKAAAQGDYAQEYLKTAGYKDADTMVDLQASNVPKNTDQTLNAIDAAEDQQTGRVYQQLQRNEDLDLNQVEIMEERAEIDRMLSYEADTPINQVASQLPDGLPVDQAEGLDLKTGRRYATYDEISPIPPYKSSILNPVTESYSREIKKLQSQPNIEYVFNPPPEEAPRLTGTSAIRFMEAEREKISGELAAKGIAALPRDIEAELANRLGPKASSYGPKYTARAQAMQTVANTGDPIAAETIKKFGLQPVTFETSNDPNPKPVTSYLKAGLFEYPISDIIPDEANRQQYLASKVAKNMPVKQQRLFNTRAPMSLEGYPSETLQVAMDPTGIMVNAPGYGVVDIAELRKPVIMGNTARKADDFINTSLQGKQEYIEDFASDMEGLKQEIYTERKQLAEQTGKALNLQLEQAKARGQGNIVRQLENQLGVLRAVYRNPELGQHREFGEGGIRQLNARVRGAVEKNNQQIQELEKKYPTTLANRTGEGSRIFGQRNVDTGEFIPETMEVRSDRSDVELGRKRGGGRNTAEYIAGARPDYSRGNPGTPPLFRKEGEKLILVKPSGLKSNIRDYDIETGGDADTFENDRTDTLSRAYTTPGGSREFLLYPKSETLTRNQGLQGPPLKKLLPTAIQHKGEIGIGSTIDKYGIRPAGEIPGNQSLRPSVPVYTKEEIRNEIARANEPIRYDEAVRRLGAQPATEAGRQSINASEEILRIQRSNPPAKAQALVSSFLQQLKGA